MPLTRNDPIVRQAAGIAAFKLNWLSLILAGNAALLPAVLIAVAQGWLGRDRVALRLVVFIVLSGITTDMLLSQAGLYVFIIEPRFVIPGWLFLLWLSFALLLAGPLSALLHQSCSILIIAGAALGVAGYGAASILEAVEFGLPLPLALLIEGITWSALLLLWSLVTPPRPTRDEL